MDGYFADVEGGAQRLSKSGGGMDAIHKGFLILESITDSILSFIYALQQVAGKGNIIEIP